MGIFHGCMGFSSLSRITSGYWCFSRNCPVLSIEFSSSHRHQTIPVCPRFLFWLAVLSVTTFPGLTGLMGVFLLAQIFLLQRINFDASVLASEQFSSVLCEHALL